MVFQNNSTSIIPHQSELLHKCTAIPEIIYFILKTLTFKWFVSDTPSTEECTGADNPCQNGQKAYRDSCTNKCVCRCSAGFGGPHCEIVVERMYIRVDSPIENIYIQGQIHGLVKGGCICDTEGGGVQLDWLSTFQRCINARLKHINGPIHRFG